MRRRMVAVFVMAVLTLPVAACGDGASADLVLPAKNIGQWVMPLDQYQLPGNSPVPRQAWMIKMTQCMRDAGFDAPQVDLSQESPPDPVFNSVGYRLTSVSVAQRYGFHMGEDLPGGYVEDAGEIMSDRLETWGDAGMAAFDACSRSYDRLLHVDDPEDANGASVLAGAARATVDDSGVLDGKEDAWYECMKPFGYPHLEDDPGRFPSSELSEQVGFPDRGDTEPVASLPSPAEIEAATNNATCLESSGYLSTLYDAEWDEEVKLLKANKPHLDEVKERQDELVAEAQEIVDAA